jgi:acyl dehydratase
MEHLSRVAREENPVTQGLYYEDWEIGKVYETAEREVTQQDAERFAEIEGHKAPMHLDEEYAKTQSVFGRLTVHGLLTLSMTAGMMGEMGLYDGTALAFLGLGWTFHEPVCVGDRIRVRWWVSSKRPTRTPDRGIVVRDIEVVLADGTKACSGTMTTLWSMRDRAPAAAGVG